MIICNWNMSDKQSPKLFYVVFKWVLSQNIQLNLVFSANKIINLKTYKIFKRIIFQIHFFLNRMYIIYIVLLYNEFILGMVNNTIKVESLEAERLCLFP